MKWMRRHPWIVVVVSALGLLFLAKTGLWVSSGCPLGFTLGSCSTEVGGQRRITASSDHLFDVVSLTSDRQTAVIDLGRKQVVVRGNLATIDGSKEVVIPDESEKVDVAVWGDRLQIVADGKFLATIDRMTGVNLVPPRR